MRETERRALDRSPNFSGDSVPMLELDEKRGPNVRLDCYSCLKSGDFAIRIQRTNLFAIISSSPHSWTSEKLWFLSRDEALHQKAHPEDGNVMKSWMPNFGQAVGCTAVIVFLALFDASSVSAQQVSTGGSTTGGSATGSTNTGSNSGTGSTGTVGGTASTFSINTSNVANTPQGFIGASTAQGAGGFVGSARESTINNNTNRQFRAINDPMSNQNRQTQQTGTPRTVTFALRLGFATPTPSATSTGFSPINTPSLELFASTHPEFAHINVALSDVGVATLTGTTSTPEASRLARNLMRLQPGVRKVDDKILVVAE